MWKAEPGLRPSSATAGDSQRNGLVWGCGRGELRRITGSKYAEESKLEITRAVDLGIFVVLAS